MRTKGTVLSMFLLQLVAAVMLWAEEIKILGIQGPSQSGGPIINEVLRAIDVSGRNLASILVKTLNENERNSWIAQYGSRTYLVPAWYSKDWRLIETGKKFFVDHYLMSPQYTDLSPEEKRYAPRSFPYLLVRDPYGEHCPYIYGFPSRFYCLNEHLEVEEEYALPFVCNSYRVLDNALWIVGLDAGYLAHRYDFTEKELTDHAVPLNVLVDALKAAEFKDEEIEHIRSQTTDESFKQKMDRHLEVRSKELESQDLARTTFEQFEKTLLSMPSSFQYDVATDGKKVGVLLRKPMGLLVASWPEGRNPRFIPVTKEVLPVKFLQLGASKLYIGGFDLLAGGHFFAYFEVLSSKTYGELLTSSPGDAQRIQETFKDRTIAPDEVVSEDLDYLGLRFEGTKVLALPMDWNTEPDWDIVSPIVFPYKSGQAWVPVTNSKNRRRGIARIQ